jgi:beta-barrel assembly-enhancing protease
MSYENPQVPHEVNVSRESAVAEFFRLLVGLGICVVLVSAVLFFFGGWLARLIPFAMERSWVGERVIGVDVEATATPEQAAVERYLQTLAAGLAARMALPEGMQLTVHYADMEVPNAFATLGGHIVITSDLYRRMPTENALAMVLAHEIAHVKARDPISGIGGSASVAVVLAVLSGEVNSLVPHISQLVLLGYSRKAESRADEAAIAALKDYYGHAGGGSALFEVLADYQEQSGMSVPSLMSTHPADAERIARLQSAAADWDAEKQPLRPIAVPEPDETSLAAP